MVAEVSYGSFHRAIVHLQGGRQFDDGIHVFVSSDYLKENGWRDFSPSEAVQLFGKLGWANATTDISLSGSFADTNLNGNGLQEQRLLARDRSSVYTQPDNTRNRAYLVNLTADHRFSNDLSFADNLFSRRIRIRTRTFNGDINDDSLGENLDQPSAAERAR